LVAQLDLNRADALRPDRTTPATIVILCGLAASGCAALTPPEQVQAGAMAAARAIEVAGTREEDEGDEPEDGNDSRKERIR
jgi:hypothetical protein